MPLASFSYNRFFFPSILISLSTFHRNAPQIDNNVFLNNKSPEGARKKKWSLEIQRMLTFDRIQMLNA